MQLSMKIPFQKQTATSFTIICVYISGHYVPQLANLMIEMNKKNSIFNLKGIAVSNIKSYLSISDAFFLTYN